MSESTETPTPEPPKFDQMVTINVRTFEEGKPGKTLHEQSSALHVNFDNRADIPAILARKYEQLTRVGDGAAAKKV